MTLFPAYTRRKPRFCALAQAILSQAQDLENTIQALRESLSYRLGNKLISPFIRFRGTFSKK